MIRKMVSRLEWFLYIVSRMLVSDICHRREKLIRILQLCLCGNRMREKKKKENRHVDASRIRLTSSLGSVMESSLIHCR